MKKTTIFALTLPLMLTLTLTGCDLSGAFSKDSADLSGGASSGGSMARFAIAGDWLYTVGEHNLRTVSLKNPAQPTPTSDYGESVGFGIETIFAMGGNLFIGSQQGMYIYSLELPESPERISTTWHTRSCDPVVAADTLAFVTLNSALGSRCGNNTNELQVYSIRNLKAPKLAKSKSMSSPRGLAVDWSSRMLFVCDENMVKAYRIKEGAGDEFDLTNPFTSFGVLKSSVYDCIVAEPGRLLVVGTDGFWQLSYPTEGAEKFEVISKIGLGV